MNNFDFDRADYVAAFSYIEAVAEGVIQTPAFIEYDASTTIDAIKEVVKNEFDDFVVHFIRDGFFMICTHEEDALLRNIYRVV